jgi:hypothetical protein
MSNNKNTSSKKNLIENILKDIKDDLDLKIRNIRITKSLIYSEKEQIDYLINEKRKLKEFLEQELLTRHLHDEFEKIINKHLLDIQFTEENKNSLNITTTNFVEEILEKQHKAELEEYYERKDYILFCSKVNITDRFLDYIILLEFNNYLGLEIEEIENKINQKNNPTIKELKWHGNKSEIIELTKALIENGNLRGKQEDIFNAIQQVFTIELNNIDQAITKFNTRENETKFLDLLKTSLSEYISTKLDKNF